DTWETLVVQLKHHKGKCAIPHGHSYKLEVALKGDTLREKGEEKNMLMDFSFIAKAVKPLIEKYLDHKWLNDTLETDSPTAEFIAQWIYQQLSSKLPSLHKVTVWETKSCKVSYLEN
ncbi:6-carboxy-5,6,7,8-tetrahydropterin synthase, partial [Chlamydiales bacterium SCGC AB-751-O23]